MEATSAGSASDEDPDSISNAQQFFISIAAQFRRNPLYQFCGLFLMVLVITTSVISWVNLTFVGRVDYVNNVTGEVVDQPEIKLKRNVNRDRIVTRMVVCDLIYPMTPALKQAIHQTMGTCAEQQVLAQIAYKESTGGLNLDNPISSASGPFQFLDGSWAAMCQGSKYSFRAQANCALRLVRAGEADQTWYRWWK